MPESIMKIENGHKSWHLPDGRLHRTDGPALIDLDTGEMSWWQYGLLHRTDGPAAICADGSVEYWINYAQYYEAQYKKVIAAVASGDRIYYNDYTPIEMLNDLTKL